jgi:hypothetical protein
MVAGDTKFAAGRVVAVMNQTLISPVGQKPCVYYKVTCEHKVTTNDVTSWRQLFCEERCVDFMLSDGSGGSVYVPGSASKMKVHLTVGATGARDGRHFLSFLSGPERDQNLHVKAMLSRHNAEGRSTMFGNVKEKLRYHEGCFQVNEQVAVMGTAKQATMNGCTIMTLGCADKNAFNETYFNEHEWSGLERKCWAALTETPALVGTDDQQYMKVSGHLLGSYVVTQMFCNYVLLLLLIITVTRG